MRALQKKKKEFDERKQDWIVKKFGLQRPRKVLCDIQAEPSFLLLDQEDKKEAVLAGWELVPLVRIIKQLR